MCLRIIVIEDATAFQIKLLQPYVAYCSINLFHQPVQPVSLLIFLDEIQTGKALFNVLDDGFSSLAGARHNIPRVLFVITNGRSSDDILKPVKIVIRFHV